jgi:hypothetical protein
MVTRPAIDIRAAALGSASVELAAILIAPILYLKSLQ